MPTAGLSRGPGLYTPRGQLLLVYLHAGVAGEKLLLGREDRWLKTSRGFVAAPGVVVPGGRG